jgi:hypothetical protein
VIHVRDPSELPPVKLPGNSNPTTVKSLSNDLLLTIFIHLLSLAVLMGAALTCHVWRRAVASSSAFRRLFCELHTEPLLRCFFETPDVVETPVVPAFPSFTPVRRGDWDFTTAIYGNDSYLTSIEERLGGRLQIWVEAVNHHGVISFFYS